jgi:hypothetical protein
MYSYAPGFSSDPSLTTGIDGRAGTRMNCVDVAKDRGNDALKGFAFRFQQLREIGIRRSNVRHSLSITLFESRPSLPPQHRFQHRPRAPYGHG